MSRNQRRFAARPFGRLEQTSLPPWVPFVFAYGILSNLPYWIASHKWEFLPDGWFCPEYAAAGIAALLLPRVLATALFASLIVSDVVSGVCRTYFLSPRECLYGITFARSLSVSSLMFVVAISASAAVAVLLANSARSRLSHKRDRINASLCLGSFALLCLGTDGAWQVFTTRHIPNPLQWDNHLDSRRADYLMVPRVSRIPLIRLLSFERSHADLLDAEKAGAHAQSFFPSAMSAAMNASEIQPPSHSANPQNVVLVLLESWGVALDLPIADALVRPYERADLNLRYKVLRGEVPFYGGTVAGEARELCSSTIGLHLLDASPRELGSCFPHEFASAGYRTIAVHGNSGYFFDRIRWYPRIGFEQAIFRPELLDQKLPDCFGAFVGTCDASVADWIGTSLAKDGGSPTFLYWVTLNSHLPVITPTPLGEGLPCSPIPMLKAHNALCSWYQLVANVHRALAKLAMSDLSRPTVFVIVGDHAPPFSNPEIRSRFSDRVVPYIILVPRGSKLYEHSASLATPHEAR